MNAGERSGGRDPIPVRGVIRILLIGIALALIAGAVCAEERTTIPSASGGPATEGVRMPEPGSAAPDFSIRDTEGGVFHFAEENAKRAVLLMFWSVFCEPCRMEMPVLQGLHDRHKDGGLEVVAVALDGEPLRNAVAGYVRQEGFTFRILIDELDSRETFKAADPYGVAWTPTLVLVERGGKVAFVKTGRVRGDELEKAVQSFLKR